MTYTRITLSILLALSLAACDDESTDITHEDTNVLVDGDASLDTQPELPPIVGVTNCETDDDCNDTLSCTTDTCIDDPTQGKICSWAQAPGTCLINNLCLTNGEAHPDDGCRVCNADDPNTWSFLADGDACDDGNACTENTVCTAGTCGGGGERTCDDDNSCTADSCDPESGCVHDNRPDNSNCDDGDLCTELDVCTEGQCAGQPKSCDDDDVCTTDSCDATTGECAYDFNTEPCDDGNPCTVDEVCDGAGACGAGVDNTCDDGNECTIDVCYEDTGCVQLPTNNPCCIGASSVCEDNNPCTEDVCDPNTAECSYTFLEVSCDDGNRCTENDTCDGAGTCSGTDVVCDDGNDCTTDACNVGVGCVTSPLESGPCDDGQACSTGDACQSGVCVADRSGCLCQPTFDDSAKLTTLAIGASKNDGEALDINGDGVNDNALAPLGGVINAPLQDSVTGGSLMLLFEFANLGPTFTLALLPSELDPANASCDFQTATCDYHAARDGLDENTCEPLVTLPATLSGTNVTAGSPTTSLPFAIPLDANTSLELTIYMVALDMEITQDSNGEVTAATGILAGAVTQSELESAILAVDPASLPADPASLISLLNTLAPNDIDIDGDGTNEAKSISLKFDGIDGVLTGAIAP